MGQSTDGILAYGWDLGGDDDEHWAYPFTDELISEYDNDTDNLLLERLGYDGLPNDYKSQIEFIKNLPFEIICHCSCDCPMYILTLRNTNWTAGRGYPINISNEIAYTIANKALADGALWYAAKKLGLNPPEPPELLLASLWC